MIKVVAEQRDAQRQKFGDTRCSLTAQCQKQEMCQSQSSRRPLQHQEYLELQVQDLTRKVVITVATDSVRLLTKTNPSWRRLCVSGNGTLHRQT